MSSQVLIESIEKFKKPSEFEGISFFKTNIYDISLNNKDISPILNCVKSIFSHDFNNNTYYVSGERKNENFYDYQHNFWRSYDYAVDVEFCPGQTDNVANTLESLITEYQNYTNDEKGSFNKISSARRFYIKLKSDSDQSIEDVLKKLSLQLDINPIVHRVRIVKLESSGNHILIEEKKCKTSAVYQDTQNQSLLDASEYNIKLMSEDELIALNNSLQLGLSLDDLKFIQAYFLKKNKNISRIEIEMLAQSWSEHCKHRIFSAEIDDIKEGLYKRYIQGATNKIISIQKEKFCYSLFSDNAGAVELNSNYLVTHKVETHNSPSSLDPFGGAITGVLGVNRDCVGFGLGAKPVMNTYAFCFPEPSNDVNYWRKLNDDQTLSNPQLSPNYIIHGVIDGIESGGNCSGIPTAHGLVHFDNGFIAKPLVFAGTIGLIPKKILERDSWVKKPENGDLIVILGGRTGKDGIHGAIFSSDSIDSNSNITHVQVGDPITQKKMFDAILEARDHGLYNAITDNGAGGLSSSIGEMGCNGFDVDLSKVLLKSHNIKPHEIWISESQERMTLAVPEENLEKFIEIMVKHVVEYQVIGRFNESNIGKISFDDQIVEIDLEFVHDSIPKYKLQSKKPELRDLTTDEIEILKAGHLPLRSYDGKTCIEWDSIDVQSSGMDLKDSILKLMGALNVSTRESVITKYDHTVQGGSIAQPRQGIGNLSSYGSVTKPHLEIKEAVAVSSFMNPDMCCDNGDFYNTALYSVETTVRNLVCLGSNPNKIGLLDNFCWSNPFDQTRIWQLKRAAEACYDGATALKAPFISGKDSMFNDFKGFDKKGDAVKLSNPPTLLISGLGIVEDPSISVTSEFKLKDDLIYLLGETRPELGGSQYYKMHGLRGGFIPNVNLEESNKLNACAWQLLSRFLLKSIIPVSMGGLIIALNKASLGGGLSFNIDLGDISLGQSIESFLFSESSGRVVITIEPRNQKNLEKVLESSYVKYQYLGVVDEFNKQTVINLGDRKIFYSVGDVKKQYCDVFSF
jgi:phosphoribosylformylglycinamidine synthase II